MSKPNQKSGARKGSALLITLLMLGVLMTMTLGISTLVIREIRVTQSIVDANKAYYAAEAGVEDSLLALSKNLPGTEPSGSLEAGNDQTDPSFSYSYSTSNKTDSVPSFPKEQPIFVDRVASIEGGQVNADCQITNARNPMAIAYTDTQLYQECPKATYRKLGLNETHIIPLFSAENDGATTDTVNDFLVEYYLNLKDGSDLYGPLQGMKLEEFDVLRWKIYGKPLVDNGPQRTESIADFYPGVTNNSADRPVCIGTDANIRAIDGANPETCVFPSLSPKPPKLGDDPTLDLSDVTLWSAARECYQTDAGQAVTGGALIKGTTIGDATGCQMRDFIDNHKENYLILTNMVNPNVAGIANLNDPSQLAKADIYYRVLARRDTEMDIKASKLAPKMVKGLSAPKLVKDFAEISSRGYSAAGTVTKSLDVRYKSPGFLPVFNFSLYKTSSTAAAAGTKTNK
jgi:Tfp pilus assembly protein PilX